MKLYGKKLKICWETKSTIPHSHSPRPAVGRHRQDRGSGPVGQQRQGSSRHSQVGTRQGSWRQQVSKRRQGSSPHPPHPYSAGSVAAGSRPATANQLLSKPIPARSVAVGRPATGSKLSSLQPPHLEAWRQWFSQPATARQRQLSSSPRTRTQQGIWLRGVGQ
jgi:hypothetical protein